MSVFKGSGTFCKNNNPKRKWKKNNESIRGTGAMKERN